MTTTINTKLMQHLSAAYDKQPDESVEKGEWLFLAYMVEIEKRKDAESEKESDYRP